ncbi:unnamed protein product [Parnassius apollo]|uniref:(apollo) hypothetical protein n=1 Tax=Parnassius apollo TaxID=110799 RepID=A0A8S3WLX1_PARAO|nr:unnamed protein product [Parnassius apollo]
MEKVAAERESYGKKPLVVKADVSKDTEAKAAIDKTIQKFEKLDILVNNVRILSVAGSCVAPLLLVSHSVSKACLNHFTRGAALELAPYGVRVNAISPGPVYTDIYENAGTVSHVDKSNIKTPHGTISDPIEIAHLVLFLSSDKAQAITGSNYMSDNGYLLSP